MFDKYLMLLLIAAVSLASINTPVFAQPDKGGEQARVEKIKAGIAKLGTGREAPITVELRDKTEVSGYVSRTDEESFVLTNPRTGAVTTVTYPQVQKVKGRNLSTKAKVAIGVGIALAVVAAVVIAAASDEVEFPNR